MPLYEYACDACGGHFEVIQKFSELTEQCRRCGKGPVRRLTSSPAIQFKGTGWYVTDYAQKAKSGGDAASGDAANSEKKDTTKSEPTKSESPTKTESSTASSSTSSSSPSKD